MFFEMFGPATADLITVEEVLATTKFEHGPRSFQSAGTTDGIQLGSDVWA